MPETEREAALSWALAEDDDVLVAAVLAAPSMLTGISKTRQQTLAGAWRSRRHGADIDRLARLQKAVADLDRAGQLTIKYASNLCDHKLLARAEASEAAVRDALNS